MSSATAEQPETTRSGGTPGIAGANYEIILRGASETDLVHHFDELLVILSRPEATYLFGWFSDEEVLEGVLTRLDQLGLELASVRRIPEATS